LTQTAVDTNMCFTELWGRDMKNSIRKFRQERGLTQKKLATMVSTSQQQIQRMENGLQSVRYDLALGISKALEQPLNKVFPGASELLGKVSQGKFDIIDDPQNAQKFNAIGIDTEVMHTALSCCLKGGFKDIFSICGIERQRLWDLIQSDGDKFIIFNSQSRCIGINRDALLYCHFLDELNEMPESSRESDSEIEIYFIGESGAEKFSADFDESYNDSEDSSFLDEGQLRNLIARLELWEEDDGVLSFMDGDGEIVFFDPRKVAVISLPLMYMYPELLEE